MSPEQPRRSQKYARLLLIGIITAYIGIIALIFIGFWFHWTWTGFFHRTLWDGMQLLLVPVVLTLGTFLFILVISRNERNLAQLRDHTAHDIALDRQREAVLQAYLGRMSEFLLANHLRLSDPGDEIRVLAQAQTVTALSRLDTARKGNLLRFLYESHLINTDLGSRIITLNGAEVRGVDLRVADLNRVDLSGADLSEADLRGANLSKADLREANLSKVDLSKADLDGANLSEADLRGANLSGSNLSGTDLSGANLSGSNLSEANLSEANLFCARLGEANLNNATLRGADLSGANLSGANLRRADLTRANLNGANLSKADLRGANLFYANLSGTDLSEAHLGKADLSTAIVTKEQSDKVNPAKKL